ncbi:GNAT family N-acetyltransferase [Cellulomonas soli]|uniref:N-acetyltransferase n=1 Tax=Cellulomonas soli TaxID=931535 RepID=A0A512PDN5_9CELL|nr:GNAT family N-acetyltransferase [Cellulomonas soli]NYI60022.1 ribosomal protein S18 acetylase RimI-like enzyme [Cellulomonas soli]GEP69324.1 N-acetyltransferase [Cellulomonas soli]
MVEQLDEVTIRIADEDDAAAIARVHVRSWQEAYAGIVPAGYLDALDVDQRSQSWSGYLRRGPKEHVRTWVAQTPSGIVGFLTLGPCRDEDARRGEREIYSVYLDPGTWGHGVARDLLRTALADLGSSTRVSLWVLADNERARHFYRRHGFQPDGVERLDELGGVDLLEVRYRRG